MSDTSRHDRPGPDGKGAGSARGLSAGLVVGVVVGAALALFVVQNTRRTQVTWLFFDARAPLWVVIVVTAVVSIVLVQTLGGVLRRSRRKSGS